MIVESKEDKLQFSYASQFHTLQSIISIHAMDLLPYRRRCMSYSSTFNYYLKYTNNDTSMRVSTIGT